MDLDIDCLREAKVENVERLATALGVKLPDRKRHDRRAYARELVRAVMLGLRRDAEAARRRDRRS
ncbi:MAG: hypothetical protein IT372_03250 [Polyangiaceae bacterium]|nr:hypothetical protein [Polyangiaceae bacterium]